MRAKKNVVSVGFSFYFFVLHTQPEGKFSLSEEASVDYWSL